MIPKS